MSGCESVRRQPFDSSRLRSSGDNWIKPVASSNGCAVRFGRSMNFKYSRCLLQ